MKRVIGLAALGCIVLAAPSAATTGFGNGSTTRCSWRQALSVPGGWFNDVAVAGGSVWAVGYRTPRGSNKTYPLISTWDGSTWTTTVGKGFGKHEDVLGGLDDDVWVTGLRNGTPVLHRFDGRTWTTLPRDVAFANAQPSGRLWMREGRQLISTTTGGKEQRLRVPRSIGNVGQFTADARGTVWVDDSEAGMFHRWNGRRWARYRYPGDVSLLYEMATGRPNEVWAVGNEIARWDGSRWKELPGGGEYQVLHDVDALGDKALAGGQDWGKLDKHGVIGEWNGTQWRWSYFGRRSPSNPADCPACDISTVEALNGVVIATDREAWAVGYGNAGVEAHGVIFRGRCR